MISRTTFCSAQASTIRLARTGADAVHLPQATGLRLDHVEYLLAERPDELPGVGRADAADHSRAEVFLDPLDRRRRGGFQKPRPELLAVRTVVDPFARSGDPLARRDRRRLPDHGHQIAMPARLGSENAEPVLLIVEGDPLDQAGQHFLRRRLRFRPHPGNDRLLRGLRKRLTTRFFRPFRCRSESRDL